MNKTSAKLTTTVMEEVLTRRLARVSDTVNFLYEFTNGGASDKPPSF